MYSATPSWQQEKTWYQPLLEAAAQAAPGSMGRRIILPASLRSSRRLLPGWRKGTGHRGPTISLDKRQWELLDSPNETDELVVTWRDPAGKRHETRRFLPNPGLELTSTEMRLYHQLRRHGCKILEAIPAAAVGALVDEAAWDVYTTLVGDGVEHQEAARLATVI